MLKRLWLILGPVFCALLMVTALLFFYPINHKHNYTEEKKAAVSLNAEGFKSRTKKQEALSDPRHRFVPYFGSSEWLRFDVVHPAVLAEKYDRNYRPYFLGERGEASLNQYFGMQQMLPEIENKQVVFVISPQWFTEKDYESAVFQSYFNSDQLTSFLENQSGDISSQHASKRLLKQFPNVSMKDIIQKIANNESLSEFDHIRIKISALINQKQANFFGQFSIRQWLKYKEHVDKYLNTIPDQFSYQKIEDAVKADAEKNTSNNEFSIDNHFYDTQIRDYLKKLKGSQTSYNYLKSSEYSDLQLVLNQFAKSKVNVMFVIPPVNKKWMDFTGLDENMYQQTVQKIRYQLESQGFTNIADFSKDGGEPFFMKDTIHLGWLGWLAFDKAVDPFLSNPTPAPTYHLNERFFSKDWATYDGDVKEFQ